MAMFKLIWCHFKLKIIDAQAKKIYKYSIYKKKHA